MIYTIVRKNNDKVIDAIISFDSISAVDESWTSTVTSQTVEYGYNVTDNINIEAPTYNISAVLSSYTLFDSNREITWNGEDFQNNGGNFDKNSHINARDELIKIFSERRMVTLLESEANSYSNSLEEKEQELKTGRFKENDSCIMTSLSISHPSEGHGAFLVNLTLQKIVTASIAISELVGDEKVAYLKSLTVVFEDSNQKQSDDEAYIDPQTGEIVEDSEVSKGGNYQEKLEENRKKYGMDKTEEYIVAVTNAEYMMSVTKEKYIVDMVAGHWQVVKASDK